MTNVRTHLLIPDYFWSITTWLRPVSLFQLHYAVQHESKKPLLDLFWLFPPSTAEITIRYTSTSITFEYVVDKLEQSWATFYKEYFQNEGQKKPAGKKNTSREKNSAGNLGRFWVVSMAHALKSPPYEGYTTGRLLSFITKHVFQQSTVNRCN